jgi:hypothetical protein
MHLEPRRAVTVVNELSRRARLRAVVGVITETM